MKTEIVYHQPKLPKRNDSFFYDGLIATLTHGIKIVKVYAAGEIRINNKAGELVHDGYKERNSGIKLETDKDLVKVGCCYDDAYYWANNNWFECVYGYKGETLNDILGVVRYEYNAAIKFAKDILKDKEVWVCL